MARFLVTMHMPNGSSEYLVHQVTGDHPSENLEQFAEELNNNTFILIHQYYWMDNQNTGEKGWRDRGPIIINTEHIGKVSLYVDNEVKVIEEERFRPRQPSFRNSRRY